MSEPTIIYWGLKARAQLPIMILTAGKVPFKWEKEPGDYKSYAPFGQLPVLKHGDATLGQSMAVTRYCAKIAGLDGEGSDWNTSEMMLEEHNDIFELFVAAKYRHADSPEAWDKCVKEDFPKHLAMLESKISGSGFFGSKMCAGDIAICSIINFGLDNGLDLAPFPKINALYAKLCSGSGPCAAYIAEAPPPYFKRPREPVTLFYFNLKARGQLPVMLLEAGKIPFKWEKEPGDYKSYTPFGQLPVLKDGDLTLGQSMAITRYCAKIAGFEGVGNDWAISEMMLEEHNDIFEQFVAAKYRHAKPDSPEAWDKCVKEDFPKHLAMLESKISGSGFFGSKMCAGDIAICSIINFGLDNGLDLAPFPKINALYAKICSGSGPCAAYIAEAPPPYFKRP